MADHVLLLLRHAKAETHVPGKRDDQRPLSPRGREQSAAVGASLGDTTVDLVLCSPSVRTRETLDGVGVDCPIDYDEEIYNAGSDTILGLVTEVSEDVETLLVVGHAPGIPALAQDLADPDTSDADAVDQLETGYPTATLARLEVDGSWSELSSGTARLVSVTVQR